MNNFILNLRPALASLILFTLIFGVAYPLTITIIAQMIFPKQSEGSLIQNPKGEIIGSALIGQNFTANKYFWSRLSATSPAYNAAASSGSNMGVNNESLIENIKVRINNLEIPKAVIPIDLITASASGLDPHISPESARIQIGRVAKARGLQISSLEKLIDQHIENPDILILGEKRINVLKLNIALDNLQQ
jgi:K+-transporting ATPase ATPase C chain